MERISEILHKVEDTYGLAHGSVLARDRRRTTVKARREVIRILREQGNSLNEIADMLYLDTHTVVHHLRAAKN